MRIFERLPLICGATDALIIFIISAFCLAAADSNPLALIKDNLAVLIAVPVPLCVLVGLRGIAHTKKLILGQLEWRRPAIEGALAGFLSVLIIDPIEIVTEAVEEALDSGSWPSLGYAINSEWSTYFLWLFKNAFIVGMIGAICGLVLSAVNRLMIKRLAANQEDTPDQKAVR